MWRRGREESVQYEQPVTCQEVCPILISRAIGETVQRQMGPHWTAMRISMEHLFADVDSMLDDMFGPSQSRRRHPTPAEEAKRMERAKNEADGRYEAARREAMDIEAHCIGPTVLREDVARRLATKTITRTVRCNSSRVPDFARIGVFKKTNG